jgi:hypothetical protein
MPAAGVAIIGEHYFGMQVVGERYGEKQEDQSAGDGGPFAQRVAAYVAMFARPSRPPEAHGEKGDEDPETIEE